MLNNLNYFNSRISKRLGKNFLQIFNSENADSRGARFQLFKSLQRSKAENAIKKKIIPRNTLAFWQILAVM